MSIRCAPCTSCSHTCSNRIILAGSAIKLSVESSRASEVHKKHTCRVTSLFKLLCAASASCNTPSPTPYLRRNQGKQQSVHSLSSGHNARHMWFDAEYICVKEAWYNPYTDVHRLGFWSVERHSVNWLRRHSCRGSGSIPHTSKALCTRVFQFVSGSKPAMRMLDRKSSSSCVGKRWSHGRALLHCTTSPSTVRSRRAASLQPRAAAASDPSEPNPSDAAVSVGNLRFRPQQKQQDIPVQYVDEFPAELEGGFGGDDMPCRCACLTFGARLADGKYCLTRRGYKGMAS